MAEKAIFRHFAKAVVRKNGQKWRTSEMNLNGQEYNEKKLHHCFILINMTTTKDLFYERKQIRKNLPLEQKVKKKMLRK